MIPSYLLLIIPIEKEKNANKDADKVDTGKTSKTFSVPYYKEGADPKVATHFVACWWTSEKEQEDLAKDFDPKQTNKHSSIYIAVAEKSNPRKELETRGFFPMVTFPFVPKTKI